MKQNPFLTSGYAGSDYFCDRVKETTKLKELLLNGNNVVLMSPRRIGKTGLLYHCFNQPEIKENCYTFIIDIYATKNIEDLIFEMGRSIVRTLKPKGQKAIEKFLEVVSALRPGVTFDVMGNATWSLGIDKPLSPEFALEQIFEYINQSDKHCLIAIDEFQQITYYPEKNVEAILRTYIQQCTNANFVFSGSERHLLSEMFNSPARPFFSSTSTLPLSILPLEKYAEFVDRHFTKAEKNIPYDIIALLYERFEGVTWYMQKVFNQLYMTMQEGEVCTPNMLDQTINEIINSYSSNYADLLYQLTSRQKQLLIAINREGKARELTSSRFIKKHHLSTASTIQVALKSLMEKQLITHNLGEYEVYDKFMSLWINKNY